MSTQPVVADASTPTFRPRTVNQGETGDRASSGTSSLESPGLRELGREIAASLMSRDHLAALGRPRDTANVRDGNAILTDLSTDPHVRNHIRMFRELLDRMGLTHLPEAVQGANPREVARVPGQSGELPQLGPNGQRVAAATFAPARHTESASPSNDAPVLPTRRLDGPAGPPETLDRMRERVMGFQPKEAGEYFTRHSDRPLTADYAEQRQRFLDRYRGAGREQEALQALDALQSRLGPDAKNPLDFHRAAAMLQTLNDAGALRDNQLCPLMGNDRRGMVLDRSLEFVNNVAHCQGNDTSIFQHIGSCGVMGTVRDGCDKAPDEMARVLAAGWTATRQDAQGRYMGDFVNSRGEHNPFYVNSSYMNDLPGGSHGEQAMMQLHASLTNIMWTPEGCEYTLGPATGQGETGATLTNLRTGRVVGDTPCTTIGATARMDQRLAMGTVRVFSEPGIGQSLGPNMVNVYGMGDAQARQTVQEALARGGGTVQMLGNGAILLGLANAGRDSYHNTSLSYDPRDGRYILTDTNRGLSDDNYGAVINGRTDGLGLVLAGLNGDNNEFARAYRLSHPGRGLGVPGLPDGEPDFKDGMKKPHEVDLSKKDDNNPHNKHKMDEDALAIATTRRDTAIRAIDALRMAHASGQDKGELHISERLLADANIDLGQFMV